MPIGLEPSVPLGWFKPDPGKGEDTETLLNGERVPEPELVLGPVKDLVLVAVELPNGQPGPPVPVLDHVPMAVPVPIGPVAIGAVPKVVWLPQMVGVMVPADAAVPDVTVENVVVRVVALEVLQT